MIFNNEIILKAVIKCLAKISSNKGQSMTEFAIMLVMIILMSIALYYLFMYLTYYGYITTQILSYDL